MKSKNKKQDFLFKVLSIKVLIIFFLIINTCFSNTKKNIIESQDLQILADKYLNCGSNKDAIEYYTKAIKLNPKNPNLYLNRGIAYANDGNCIKAQIDFDFALKFKFDSKFLVYYNKAYCYSIENNPQIAILLYSKSIAENSKYANSYNNRGVEYEKLYNYSNALIDYLNAILYDSNNYTVYYNIAKIKNYYKEKKDALFYLNKSLDLKSDYKETLILRADCYVYLNELDNAIKDYSKLIDLDKTNSEYLLKRGYCYAKANVYAMACADFKKAKELNSIKADEFIRNFCK